MVVEPRVPHRAATPAVDETAEVLVYDPALGSVSMDVPLETARAFHAQIATADGGALVQGGSQLDAQPSPSLEFDVTALDSATHYGVNGAGDSSEDWGDEVIINDGKGMCWFCHLNGWYCGFPCLPIPITGGELLSGLGSGGSGGSVVSLQSDWTTQSTIGWPLVPRSLPGMAWEQDQSHLIVTGGAATVEAEVLVVGDGSKF